MTVGPATALPPGLVADLRRARSVAVLTGAGVSAESGLATFRDADGLWSRFKPEELGTREAFRREPARVWSWYAERRRRMAEATPNPGHVALAAIEARVPAFALLTQNIDGLHQRAGNRNVIELHGSIHRLRCLEEDVPIDDLDARPAQGPGPPRCRRCGGLVRPDVVWFGEMLPAPAWQAAVAATSGCDLFLSVGTSGVVEPAARLPYEAHRAGARVVEVNPRPTALAALADWLLCGPSGALLPALVQAAWP